MSHAFRDMRLTALRARSTVCLCAESAVGNALISYALQANPAGHVEANPAGHVPKPAESAAFLLVSLTVAIAPFWW